ncbi:MAG TPA: MvaI/BcnI family restriction endonuclease [Candidatus Paceibacterota bacterium]|nr:MvaI/BcnI family restriction endonuclease [Candidatus Paceibacterota bacterium]
MERQDAVLKLRELEGKDLRPLADHYQVTVWRGGKKNKGWAGHVIERYLGLPINSSQSPNFGSWELKIVPLKQNSRGELRVKETMAITMIDSYNVAHTPFEQSHLLTKLRKAVVCARVFESQLDERSILVKVATFDLDDPEVLKQVEADYNLVRQTIIEEGFNKLTGRMGVLVQPRTKGPGRGSTSRAFYARTGFVAKILELHS